MKPHLRRHAAALVAVTLGAAIFGTVPAANAAYGTVSGVVTGPAGPIEGVKVHLFQYDAAMGYWDEERETSTNADLAAAAHITGKLTAPAGSAMVDNRVIAYEAVHEDGGIYYRFAAEDMINADGTYDLAGLRGGTYRVQFGDGVAYDQFAVEYYNDKPSRDTAEDLVVAAGGLVSGVDAQLGLPGEISGRLTDGTGAPEDGLVTAFTKVATEWVPVAQAETDYDGTYLLEGLGAANYRVGFVAYSGGVELVEYWNDKARLADASDVVLVAGGEVADVDAQLIAGEHEPASLDNVTAPMISGTPQVGSALTVSTGTWSASPQFYNYYWFAGDDYVQGPASATYVPTAADLGKAISVMVIAIATGYDDGFVVAGPTAPVVAAPVVVSPVVTPPVVAPPVDVPSALAGIMAGLDVTGKPKVGKTLKVAGLDVALRTAVTYKFQWYAGTKKIKKATKSKLKLIAAMKGKKISVKVTATASTTSKTVKLKVGKVR